MFSPRDTIVALSTPPGRGGIGVVRLSGPRAHEIARMMLAVGRDLEPRHATLTHVVGEAGAPIDEAVATFFPAPHSYTTEDVVEISAHGSPALLRAIVAAGMRTGARLAEPGEFTLRAFLNGRLDLVQAEAVADLVDAVTPLQARVAFDQLDGTLTRAIAALDGQLFDLVAQLEASLDFPEEGYHFATRHEVARALGRVQDGIDALLATARGGRVIREGRQLAILGKPNVGKSTLFNALVGSDRAIVTPAPGTTRDLVTERVDFEGIRLGLVDTAGIRDAQDEAEQQGVVRARRAAEVADLVLLVLDLSRPLEAVDWDLIRETGDARRVVVANKADLPHQWPIEKLGSAAAQAIAVTLREGSADGSFLQLKQCMRVSLEMNEPLRDVPMITNLRHEGLLRDARESIVRARATVESRGVEAGEELVLADLAGARRAFEEITGRRTTDDVLRRIFERFCIGK